MALRYSAQPKQILFHNATAEEVLYGGAAGGGKSKAILWDSVFKATKYPGARIGIFRRTYPELEKSLIFNFLSEVPQDYYKYSKQEHRASFHNKSVIDFNHCQYEQDVFRYQSVEYDFLYFDELTHFTEFIYKYLLSRLRTTTEGLKTQVKCGSNPGNIGHGWVKRRFIEGVEPNVVTQKVDENDIFPYPYEVQFIPAKLYDNKILMDLDPSYEGRLKRLPENDRRALLEGDWDVFKGQFFSEWNANVHVVESFEIPKDWKRFRAIDWGFSAPSAVLWFALKPDSKDVYIYRELYVSRATTVELADQILGMSYHEDGTKENIAYTVADPSLWSINQYERGESTAYRLAEHGLPLVKADNNRQSGWAAVRDYLWHDEDNEPALKVFENCKNLVRTLPEMIFSKNNSEDLDTTAEDHAVDALRYGIMSNPKNPRSPINTDPAANTFNAFLRLRAKQKQKAGYVGGR
jgi:PBSX family phage terminase large subunit